MRRSNALFSHAFRPLFLLSGCAGFIYLSWWIGSFVGLSLPPLAVPGYLWHSHEMLYGFVGAAIGGFLLTAVANWTGRAPTSGFKLKVLVFCWLIGRICFSLSGVLPPWLVALADCIYFVLLAGLMAQHILAANNQRNIKILFILALFVLLNLMFHSPQLFSLADQGLAELAMRASIALVCLLIAIIGGRIIPNFTLNFIKRNKPNNLALPVTFNRFDSFAIVFLVAGGLGWTIWPTSLISGNLILVAGLLQLARLSRWQGLTIVGEPMLLVLHVGYVWLGIGLILVGLSTLIPSLLSSAGIHALTLGAMVTLIIGVSSRAALGHSGREIKSSPLMNLCFVLISMATICRVLASIQMGFYWPLIIVATVCILFAFLLYLMVYFPILYFPASDSR